MHLKKIFSEEMQFMLIAFYPIFLHFLLKSRAQK